jgi:hypothetical protein
MITVGCFSAFIFGLISLSFMVRFLRNYTFLPIIIYRILLGLFIMANNTNCHGYCGSTTYRKLTDHFRDGTADANMKRIRYIMTT